MKIYEIKDPSHAYNVIGFDEPVELRPDPITLAGETIRPGDRITAILGRETSAGFGKFSLASGYITYAGRYTVRDERGELEYVLFKYDFLRDADDTINGHQSAYVCWGYSDRDGILFYDCGGSSRIIRPCEVKRSPL